MGHLRKHAQELSRRTRLGDVEAARDLLRHSIRLGHQRLALRRMFLARFMGAKDLGSEAGYCAAVAADLPEADLAAMAAEARRLASIYVSKGASHA